MISTLLSEITNVLVKGRGGIGIGLACDENGEPDYEQLVWESETFAKPSKEEFDLAVHMAKSLKYRDERRAAYPSIDEQLDILFHNGYEGWKELIQAVKDQFPKPN